MPLSPVPKVGLWLLLATSCLALPKQKLSDVITHYEKINYDLQSTHQKHQAFSKQWQSGDTSGDNLLLTIHAFGRDFRMELRVNEDLFSDDVTFMGGNGKPFEVNRAEFVVGHLVGERHSHVHGTFFQGRFRGVIDAHGEKYMIESSLAHFDKGQPFHSVMYRDSDVLHHKIIGNKSCASAGPASQSVNHNMYQDIQSQVEEQVKSRQRRQTFRDKVECQINIAGDHTFAAQIRHVEALPASDENRLRASVGQALALFVYEANRIFTTTTFLSDSTAPEGIRIVIKTVHAYISVEEMKTFRSGTQLADNLVSPNIVLTEWSRANWNEYCLSSLFSHRDYDRGVLGLAYVDSLCQRNDGTNSQNTAITTTLNSGRPIPSLTAFLVYGHELGHNFGSSHDKDPACQPSDSDGGKYIMFATATSGLQTNNRKFSPCSRAVIGKALTNKAFTANSCFRPKSNGEICGNRVKEGNESCDCGSTAQCAAQPNCCMPSGCKYATGAICSVQDGPCCRNNCSYVTQAEMMTCSEAHECRVGVETCNGNSSLCPRAAPRPNGELCNKKRFTCDRGDCNGSLCIIANLSSCYCAAPHECTVCCEKDGKCMPLRDVPGVNTTGLSVTLIPGSPCQEFSGYCNFLNFCRRINDTGVLFQLTSALFSLNSFQSAWDWAKDNWYYVLLGFAGIVLVFVFIIHFGAKKTPRTVPIRSGRTVRPPKSDVMQLVAVSEDAPRSHR